MRILCAAANYFFEFQGVYATRASRQRFFAQARRTMDWLLHMSTNPYGHKHATRLEPFWLTGMQHCQFYTD